MSAVHLGLLLHFYQPPGQVPGVLRRIVNECYRPLIRVFREHPNARASFNINAVLTEMLDDHGYHDVIEGLAELAASGRVEITGSGKYHPILPLIPQDEAARQIALHNETNARLLGPAYRPRGFFPPEMSWDHSIAPLVAQGGHEWVIMSGIACPVTWPLDRIHREHAGARDLAVLFRDDLLSNKISFKSTDVRGFLEDLRALADPAADRYVVIAMDAETYGHHIPHWEQDFLANLFQTLAETDVAPARRTGARGTAPLLAVKPAMLSDLVDRVPAGTTIVPRASSWSTTQDDLSHGNPYPLWRHRGNEIHRLLWRHLEQTLALFTMAQGVLAQNGHAGANGDLQAARAYLDMALHSDQFWWASRRPHWSVNLVHRGLTMQRDTILNAMRVINLSDAPDEVRGVAQERVAIARDTGDRITDRLFWD